jgi:hypothetical protein
MIEVTPSYIAVKGYKKEKEGLERFLTVFDTVYFQASFEGFIKYKDILILPRGIDPQILKKYFPYKDIKRKKVKEVNKLKGVELNEEFKPRDAKQVEAIDFLNGKDNTQKILALRTGDGKTYCSIHYFTTNNLIPLITVDQLSTMKQWRDEIIKFTNLEEENIFFIAGKDTIKELEENEVDNNRVYVASHRTISNLIQKDPIRFFKLIKKLNIGVKIYDEAHVEWENILRMDSFSNVKYNIYLTATPSRSNYKENRVYQRMFESVPKYGLKSKYDNAYNKILMVEYDTEPGSKRESKMKTGYGFSTNKYSDYIENEKYDYFLEIIVKLVKKMGDRKVAIIVHKNSLLLKLAESLSDEFSEKEVGTFSSVISDIEERKKELDKDIIVSTDKSFDKAIDVENLEGLINTVPMSSETKTEQLIGRLRENDSIFIDMTDVGFKSTKRQQYYRKKILQLKAKGNIAKIKM